MQNTDAVAWTKKLVGIESTNPGKEEHEIAGFLEQEIRAVLPERGELKKDYTREGRPVLLAVLPGETKEEMVLICHMDTVPVAGGWTKNPLGEDGENGRFFGRGSCDMKSGLACCLSAFIMAARTLHASGQTPKRTLKLICSMDEEDFMRGSEACIGSGWVTSKDWVIDAEPTNGQIQMAHKGRTWYEIDVEGHTAHASTPWKGADAIAAMAEIISTLRQDILDAPSHPDMGISTVTFGQITGGYRPYVVPNHCKLWIDMRLVPPLNTTRTTQFVQNAIHLAEDKVTGIKAAYTITGDRPPIEMNPDSPLLAELKKACHHVTGHQPEVSCFTGYTDTAVIAGQLHNRNCMSYGPGCLEAAHQPDEWVVIDDIIRCEKVYHQLISSNIL